MSSSTTEARRSDRRLLVGDTVLVFRETGSKLKDKWNDRFDGPFVVVEKLGSNIYLVQRMGSDDRPQREHVDNLVAAPILTEAVTVQTTTNTLPVVKLVAEATSEVISDSHKAPLKKYEVEEVAGHEDGKYLVKRKGYDAATWEPMENLDCARLIKNFFKLTTTEKDKLRKNTVTEASTLLAPLAQLHNIHASALFLNADLSKIEKCNIIEHICEVTQLSKDQLFVVWASPDCRAYSRADTSNISRNNHHRDHSKSHRPPKTFLDDKKLKAISHDGMVQNLLLSFQSFLLTDSSACFILENPAASLRRHPFVVLYQMLLGLTRPTIEYCAFGAEVKKATDIWTSFDWSPVGITGDGCCHRRCSTGRWVKGKDGKKYFRHPKVIAGDIAQRPTGPFAKSRVPAALHHDLLLATVAHHSTAKTSNMSQRTVVLDLFAGSTSLEQVPTEMGYDYIAVDYSKASRKCFQR